MALFSIELESSLLLLCNLQLFLTSFQRQLRQLKQTTDVV